MNIHTGTGTFINTDAISVNSIIITLIIATAFALFIIVSLTLSIIGFNYFIKKLQKPLNIFSRKTKFQCNKTEFPNGMRKKSVLDKKDFTIVVLITFVYLLLSIVGLGNFKIPKTLWKASEKGESFEISLGRKVNVSRIYYYQGYGNGSYRIEYMDGAGNFIPLTEIKKTDFFIWKYAQVSVETNHLRIIVDIPKGSLHEIGIFEKGSNKPLSSLKIIKKKTDVCDGGKVENLFDEQDTIEYKPSFLTGMYFDEIYFAKTAYEYINHLEPSEMTHPPIGKIIISLGIMIFGMNPFGWRIFGVLFGAAIIIGMYIFGKRLFQGRFYASCSAFLMAFDFMLFSQSRIATVDVYLIFFIIITYYFMYVYLAQKLQTLENRPSHSMRYLFLSSVFLGLGAATKWIALYALPGLILLFIFSKYHEYRTYSGLDGSRNLREWWKANAYSTTIAFSLSFITIPGMVYILSYIPVILVPGHNLLDIFFSQINMYIYHSTLTATHSFSSLWWEWPLIRKPICFFANFNLPPEQTSVIFSMGNPAIWWTGMATMTPALFIAVKKRDINMLIVFVAIICQYLPWIVIDRLTFIYHFFSVIPFIILVIVYVIRHIIERNPNARYAIYSYLSIVALLFVIFYPVLSGMVISEEYVKHLKWFKSWAF